MEKTDINTQQLRALLNKFSQELEIGFLERRGRSQTHKIDPDVDEYASTDEMVPGQEFHVLREEVVPTDGILMEPAEFDFSLITGLIHD